YIKSPKEFGTICPASKFLCNKMIRSIKTNDVYNIAELGSADGVLTKEILIKIPNQIKLDAYEINNAFYSDLYQLTKKHKNLSVFFSSASSLKNRYDVIFSCLPFLSFPIKVRISIINNIYYHLNDGGVFILYQYSNKLEKILSKRFYFSRELVLMNVPPAYVYRCVSKC
ncbi:class I SAM-dependent methyltransferase, partial [Providencia rettgeri]